jgi:hypothetical protein
MRTDLMPDIRLLQQDFQVDDRCEWENGSCLAGDTTLTCTAKDTAGNAASGTFTIRVNSAAEQLTALQAYVTAHRAAARILSPTLHHTANALAAGETTRAKMLLGVVAAQASALAGSVLTSADAAHISQAARRIRGCLTAVPDSTQRGKPQAR